MGHLCLNVQMSCHSVAKIMERLDTDKCSTCFFIFLDIMVFALYNKVGYVLLSFFFDFTKGIPTFMYFMYNNVFNYLLLRFFCLTLVTVIHSTL